jgi:site-specific recombinase XerD
MTINWKVAEPNTLRAYNVAVKDFETVTGIRVDQADAASISAWQASMEGRGLSINTIRQRLSAVSVISGVKVQLPKRPKAECITLSADQVRAMFQRVIDGADRMLLMRLLTLGSRARRVVVSPDGSFMAHFLGQANEQDLTAQEVTRRLKRYARKAGLDHTTINLRTWCISGRWLLKNMSIKEVVSLAPSPIDDDRHVTFRPLHGINRRTNIKA